MSDDLPARIVRGEDGIGGPAGPDPTVGRTDQERSADRLAEALTAVAVPVAQSRPRVAVSAPTQERTETIKSLVALGRSLPDFCKRAYLDEIGPGHWAELSDALLLASRACREQVVIDATTAQGSPSHCDSEDHEHG